MKFKLNRGKSIKLGDKEIPISTTDGWTDIPDDEIIEILENAGVEHRPVKAKEDALIFLSKKRIIAPCYQNGTFYTSTTGDIYVI